MNILNSEKLRDERIYVFPTSAIKQDGVKINYHNFLMTTDNPDCIKALETIGTRIDMDKIKTIVDSTPYISDTQKEFYTTMIQERKEKIIDAALTHHGIGLKKQQTIVPPSPNTKRTSKFSDAERIKFDNDALKMNDILDTPTIESNENKFGED
ncbi:hypothetical protein LJC32_01405 [Oscillospiraceae bacterium OttesenSCG-928-F05]|nr:hypothetical protein [Oscillospiraceae bacterium OttesenSCG-928-F05]